jgi:hypothetical protein
MAPPIIPEPITAILSFMTVHFVCLRTAALPFKLLQLSKFFGLVFFENFFVATFRFWKVATFRLGALRFGLFFVLGFESFAGCGFCGLRLLRVSVAFFDRVSLIFSVEQQQVENSCCSSLWLGGEVFLKEEGA